MGLFNQLSLTQIKEFQFTPMKQLPRVNVTKGACATACLECPCRNPSLCSRAQAKESPLGERELLGHHS